MAEELNIDAMVTSVAEGLGAVEGPTESVEGQAPAEPSNEVQVVEPVEPSSDAGEGEDRKPTLPENKVDSPPRTWKPGMEEYWSTLPGPVKEEILRREEDIYRGIEQYKTISEQAQGYLQAISPYMEIIRQQNINPVQLVQNLLAAQYKLSMGSLQERTAMMQQLAKSYGVEWGADAQMIDPKVSEQEMRLSRLEQQLAQDIRARTVAEVEAFASELDQYGKPLRPYFDDVADDIVQLIQSGQAKDLSEAYEKAIWLNPATREKEIARLKLASQEKAKREAETAKRAEAANVRTSAKAATAGSPTGSIDDTLRETLKAIRARA